MDNKGWLSWIEYAENDFEVAKLQRTHDLVVLCETCTQFDSDFEKILGLCSDLTIYASEIRYPNILEIEPYHMLNAINDASIT